MKNFLRNLIVPMISGAVGAYIVTLAVTPSFATTTTQKIQDAIQAGQCQVNVGYGRLTGGSRCFMGEVMTGYWNDNVYCATVQVSCD